MLFSKVRCNLLIIADKNDYEYLLKNYRDYIAKYYYKNKPEPDIDR